MFADGKEVPKGTTLQTDICIVGGGAAGITLARELIGTRYNVTLLESGGFEFESKTQSLYEGRSIGVPYSRNLSEPRLRMFGGTTNHWGGYCRPFEEADFLPRKGIPYTGWPLRKADLDPYYKRAVPICKLPTDNFDLDYWLARDPFSALPLKPSDRIVNRIAQVVPLAVRSFGKDYKDQLRRARNVKVVLHANVRNIDVDQAGRTVTGVDATTLGGNRFSVAAKLFVLSAGAIENVRLLLVSNKRFPKGLANQNDLVGRFFLEHPRFVGAYILPSNPDTNVAFYDIHKARGGELHGFIGSTKQFQLAEGLLDVQFRPEASLTTDVSQEEKSFADYLKDLVTDLDWQKVLVPGAPVPIPYPEFIREFLDHPRKTYSYLKGEIGSIGLSTRFEPAPNRDSRIVLVRERDRLGMQRVALNWQLSRIDKHNVRRTLEVLGAEIGRSGLGRLKITFDENESGWPDDLGGGQHLMGTTRMNDDPKQGVVDRNLRVHGMSNFFIGGSSVFPTAGGATPTLMIVALTLRLADHLKETLR